MTIKECLENIVSAPSIAEGFKTICGKKDRKKVGDYIKDIMLTRGSLKEENKQAYLDFGNLAKEGPLTEVPNLIALYKYFL